MEDLEALKSRVYSISDIEAQLILLRLGRVTATVKAHIRNAREWARLLAPMGDAAPHLLPAEDNVFTKMLVWFPGPHGEERKRMFRRALWRSGVETESSYVPLHTRPAFSHFPRSSMPFADEQWRGALSLPARPSLGPQDWGRIEHAIECLIRGRV